MNTFSTVSKLYKNAQVSTNTLSFVNRYVKILSLGVSGGTAFSDLSATALYSTTSMGINMTNQNTTFSTLKYNGNLLKTSDIAPTNTIDYTIYCKYKCRTNILPILNRMYPNVISAIGNVTTGSNLTLNFFSSLNSGTVIPYRISGVTSANLSPATLSGTVVAPYQSLNYTVSGGTTMNIDISGGTTAIVIITQLSRTVYTVTVSGGVYWISTNGATADSNPNLTFSAGNVYVFDQSHVSNVGFPLRLSTTVDGPVPYTTRVVTNGTPGSANAYTLIDVNATTTLPLYYYSTTAANMGYVPLQPPFIWYKFNEAFGSTATNFGSGGLPYNGVITNTAVPTVLSYETYEGKNGLYSNSNSTNKAAYLVVPYKNVTVPCSMSLWIYIISKGGGDTIVFENFDSGSTVYFNIFLDDGNNFSNATSGISIQFNKWLHYVQTYNPTTQVKKMYIDKVLVETKTNVSLSNNRFGGKLMGAGNAYNMLNGVIADFRFYETELSTTDISDLFSSFLI